VWCPGTDRHAAVELTVSARACEKLVDRNDGTQQQRRACDGAVAITEARRTIIMSVMTSKSGGDSMAAVVPNGAVCVGGGGRCGRPLKHET
jgi:hypothetical protein